LLRACALRLDSYGNEECRRVLKGYIEFIFDKYADQLHGVVKNIPMKQVCDLWKSDAYIEALYSGYEGSSSLDDYWREIKLICSLTL